MRLYVNVIWTGVIIAFILSTPVAGYSADKQKEAGSSGAVMTIGSMAIDKIKKEIRLSVKLALQEGILEYLLVGIHGKTYESVFKISHNKPSDLNFALLLIGCEPMPGDKLESLKAAEHGRDTLVKDDAQHLLEVEVWRDGKNLDVYTLIKDRENKKSLLLWVYTGGQFTQDNRYTGDYDLSFMGIWSDPSAVINLFSPHGNPYRGNMGFEMDLQDRGYRVDQDFTLVIRRFVR